jgi:hypothetical protein
MVDGIFDDEDVAEENYDDYEKPDIVAQEEEKKMEEKENRDLRDDR